MKIPRAPRWLTRILFRLVSACSGPMFIVRSLSIASLPLLCKSSPTMTFFLRTVPRRTLIKAPCAASANPVRYPFGECRNGILATVVAAPGCDANSTVVIRVEDCTDPKHPTLIGWEPSLICSEIYYNSSYILWQRYSAQIQIGMSNLELVGSVLGGVVLVLMIIFIVKRWKEFSVYSTSMQKERETEREKEKLQDLIEHEERQLRGVSSSSSGGSNSSSRPASSSSSSSPSSRVTSSEPARSGYLSLNDDSETPVRK